MDASIYSFLIALAWCNVFVLFGIMLRHKTDFVLKYGVNFILLIMSIGILRLFIPIESRFSIVLASNTIMPFLQRFLRAELFQINNIWIDRFEILIWIWLLGSFLYLLSIALRIAKLKRAVRRIPPEDNRQAVRVMNTIICSAKIRRQCRIIVSEDVATPMLVGYFKPTILLPCLSLSDEELRYVLLHEWGHFTHKHLWTKLLFNILCALLWWNPLVYMMKANMDNILEISCDRLVVDGMDDSERVKYVESTTKVMRQMADKMPQLALSSVGFIAADTEAIVQRCELVLFPPKRFSSRTKYILGTAILCLTIFSYAFVVQPDTPPPIEEGHFTIGYENSYLVPNNDDTYSLYINKNFLFNLDVSEIYSLPYSELPMRNEENIK
ncbi:MAG: M56 family metallopeptidase [Clostridiales bacterium]|nr:M56 family metallopeptidase [Clostridiales bacterium]